MTDIRTYRKIAKLAEKDVPTSVTAEYGDDEDFHELFSESIQQYVRRVFGHAPDLARCKWFASWDDCIQLCNSEKDAIAIYLMLAGRSDLLPYDYGLEN